MRARDVAGCTSVVAVVLAACNVDEPKDEPCETDASACPASSRTATVVTCACRCERRSSMTKSSAYAGDLAFCLPARLNAKLASPTEQAELAAMSAAAYNQNVFRFCSETAARFVDRVVERQQHRDPRVECIGAVSCSCTTKGASGDSTTCSRPCADLACGDDNCPLLLRQYGQLSNRGCRCTRVSTCGETTPPAGDPPLCAPAPHDEGT